MAFLCKKVRLLPLYSHFIVSSEQTRFFQLKLYPFQCKKAFRKDMTEYEEADEYCPHCDNQYVIEAKEPQAMVGVEGEDARIDNRWVINFSDHVSFTRWDDMMGDIGQNCVNWRSSIECWRTIESKRNQRGVCLQPKTCRTNSTERPSSSWTPRREDKRR